MKRKGKGDLIREEDIFSKEIKLIRDLEWIREMSKQLNLKNNTLHENCRKYRLEQYALESEFNSLSKEIQKNKEGHHPINCEAKSAVNDDSQLTRLGSKKRENIEISNLTKSILKVEKDIKQEIHKNKTLKQKLLNDSQSKKYVLKFTYQLRKFNKG